MYDKIFSMVGSIETLMAVILGALLATGGALLAERIQERRQLRQAEKDAANAFGMMLVTVVRWLQMFLRSRDIGDVRWGRVTETYLLKVQHNLDWFMENRHLLFDICDIELRNEILRGFSLLEFPILGLANARDEKHRLEEALDNVSQNEKARLQARLEQNEAYRERACDVLEGYITDTDDLLHKLSELSGQMYEIRREEIVDRAMRSTMENTSTPMKEAAQ